jgi:1-acyl-sn-glycerol-3-phosphate acyltransferase
MIDNTLTQPRAPGYNHSALERRRGILRWLLRTAGYHILYKYEGVAGLPNMPSSGPAILMINHVALVDPIAVIACLPRNVVPLAKAEGLRNPLFAPLLYLWQVIPVRRGEVDRRALRRVLQVLDAGECVLMAPEGTRHPNLQEARTGLAYVAWRSGAPIVPVSVIGTEGFPSFSPARWRQPGATISLGRPFRYRPFSGRPDHDRLRLMMDEAMYVLAAMLPERQRGVYSNLDRATMETIELV